MDELLQKLISHLKNSSIQFDHALIQKAYEMAKNSHRDQKRLSGEPFYYHPVEVAILLTDLKLDQDSIIAALLHDTLEDTDLSPKEIEDAFGKDVLKLVKGVTNLRGTELRAEDDEDFENIKKLIMASTDDVRVIIIKLADRMHNARTIDGLKPERRVSYATEILNIFAPLSDYLGIGKFRNEFQDIAFKYIHPDEFERIDKDLKDLTGSATHSLEDLTMEIDALLKKSNIKSKIQHRAKGRYSTYKKIKKYKKEGMTSAETKDILDRLAVRIIVDTIEQCYLVLGIIHQRWNLLKEEFDDYISNPKPNGYKSLHTVIETKRWGIVEVHIRTKDMDEVAEYGAAAHAAYKNSGQRNTKPTNAFTWIKDIIWAHENEAIKNYNLNLFENNIYVFTPDKKLIELPKGATPIDFAYHIHSNIGDNCIGAIVNTEMVPLNTKLQTNDQVQILVSKSKKYPKRDWLTFVVDPNTKASIRKGLREQERVDAIEYGKRKVAVELRNKNIADQDQDKFLVDNINRIKVKDLNEAYERIGHGLLSVDKVMALLFPQAVKEKVVKKISDKTNHEITIEGQTGIKTLFSKCCNPKAGDNIVALMSNSSEAKIHKPDCKHIVNQKEKRRILNASWGE